MIIPLFTYCSILTLQLNKTQSTKISSFERRANELIFSRNSIKEISKIQKLARKRICSQVFDCLSNRACTNFTNYFELMDNCTRNKNKLLRLPAIKLESSRKSFFFNGAKSYNELPLRVREAKTKKQFLD